MNAHVERYKRYLEALTPSSLEQLSDYVTSDVRFRDPFNDVRGVDAMSRVFTHMFQNVGDVHFVVETYAVNHQTCLMEWRYDGILQGQPWSFMGTSSVQFTNNGMVHSHIDYWDAAGNFYERLAVIGFIIRWIRKRLAVH